MPSLMFPRILYENHARTATIVASGAQAGFPAKAAQNDNTYEFWKPTSVPATWRSAFGSAKVFSALGIAVHDLGTVGGSVQTQYSYNDVDWIDASDVHTPIDDSEILLLFPPQSAPYARARFTGAVPTIAHIRFGRVLSLEHGIAGPHAPANLSRRTEARPNEAERGQWLGASVIRSGLQTTVPLSGLSWSWYRANFDSFAREARDRARPFFFAWQPSKAPQDVAYCRLEGDVAPQFRAGELVDVSLSLAGANRVS